MPINFPKPIQEVLRHDHDLVALGRAKEEILKKGLAEGYAPAARQSGKIGKYYVIAEQEIGLGSDNGKEYWIYAAASPDEQKSLYGVTPSNPFEKGLNQKGQILSSAEEPDEDHLFYEELMGLSELLEEMLWNMLPQDEK